MSTQIASPSPRVAQHPPASAAGAARHFADRLSFETDPSDLHHDLEARTPNIVVVDTRSPEAYRSSHIPGAVNLPASQMTAATTAHLSKESLCVTYCWGPGCNGSTKGALQLASLGFAVKELIGGIEYWQKEGYAVESGGKA